MKAKVATLDDLDTIISMRINALEETENEEPFTDEELEHTKAEFENFLRKALNKTTYIVLGYDEYNLPVSMVNVNIYGELDLGLHQLKGKFAEIYGLYTVNGQRGKGYASGVLNKLVKELNPLDLTFFELIEYGGESTQIYRKLGFTEVRFIQSRYFIPYWLNN